MNKQKPNEQLNDLKTEAMTVIKQPTDLLFAIAIEHSNEMEKNRENHHFAVSNKENAVICMKYEEIITLSTVNHFISFSNYKANQI